MPIESAANPLMKRMRTLEQRKGRERENAFVVEGIGPVWQAVDGGAAIETLVVAPELLTSESARAMIAGQEAAGVRVAEVSADLFARVAARENPSGVAAIVRMERRGIDALAAPADGLFVALCEVGNPGNLGTILRTVDAVGGSGVILVGDTTDPYHPAAVKASMGTLFRVPVVRAPTYAEVDAWCASHAVSTVTTSARATADCWGVTYPISVCLVFGSEGRGLPTDVMQRGTISVRIPMEGSASSLNLAVSAGILLYEVFRQRRG